MSYRWIVDGSGIVTNWLHNRIQQFPEVIFATITCKTVQTGTKGAVLEGRGRRSFFRFSQYENVQLLCTFSRKLQLLHIFVCCLLLHNISVKYDAISSNNSTYCSMPIGLVFTQICTKNCSFAVCTQYCVYLAVLQTKCSNRAPKGRI